MHLYDTNVYHDCGDAIICKRSNCKCKGQVAVITGSIKDQYIIYKHNALRGGATVVATTRVFQ
jgi:3-oxoacyl-ACP reductase-like protein